MKIIFYLTFIYIFYFSKSIPHFIYDGLELYRQCFDKEEQISFIIFGTLIGQTNLATIRIEDYSLKNFGKFKCNFSENEDSINEKRKHKIVCSIKGSFPRFSYIIEEPQLEGLDFLNENGESSWPKMAQNKTILFGGCGSKIELDEEPLLLSSSSTPYSNPIGTVRKSIIDSILASLPERNIIDELKMAQMMKSYKQRYYLNEAECAYLVYIWIAKNIEYNCGRNNNGEDDYGELTTYKRGKGNYSGISDLFVKFCNYLELEAMTIPGYLKTSGKNNYSWNSVKIDSVYYLVDVPLGSGYCIGDSYFINFKEFHFCTNPELFIRFHFPIEEKWQLLTNTITYQQFDNMAVLYDDFFIKGFKSITPDLKTLTVEGRGKITLTYDESIKDILISCELVYENNGKILKETDSNIWSSYKGNIEIIFNVNYLKEYYLSISVNINNEGYLKDSLLITINNTKAIFPPQYLPYEHSIGKDVRLIEPLNGLLKKGTFVDIIIQSSVYEEFYIIIGKYFKRKLEKLGDGNFIAESVYIFGDITKLSHKKGNTYYCLYRFTNRNNSELLEEPTFPETSLDLPPHTLYSPITDILKIGNSYTFVIKCKTATEMFVFDGNDFYDLVQDENVFSGNITINDNVDQVVIAGYLDYYDDIMIFYYYEVSA